jgi:hypothetical protein
VRTGWVRAALLAPVFLYVAALNASRFGAWDPLVALVMAAMALPFLELIVPGAEGRFFVPAWALAMVSGIGLAQGVGAPGGLWAIIGAGVLLGAPLTILAGLIVWRESVFATVLGVIAGLGALIALLAGSDEAIAAGGSSGATGWVVAFSKANLDQFSAIVTWVNTGGLTNATPFGAVGDPAFLGLALVAGFTVILALLERPIESGRGPEPSDPLFHRSSGVVPLVVAVLAGLGFEWAAAAEARYALIAVVAGILVTLVALELLALAPAPARGQRHD